MNWNNVFGFSDYDGLLSEKDISSMQGNALTQMGLSMLANSTQQGYKPRLGQLLAQGYLQGQQSGQGALKGKLEAMRLKDKLDERKQKKAMQEGRMGVLSGIEDASPERLSQAYAAALRIGDLELAKLLAEQIKSQQSESPFGKVDPSKFTGDSLAQFKATGDYRSLVPVDANDTETIRTLRALQQNPDLFRMQEQLKKAGATQVNMPSESERTAGFLVQRLQGGLQSLASAVGADPTAAKPSMVGELVGKLTNSDTLKNLTLPENRQQVEAAQLEILDSALTLGTGAAYTREQLEGYRRSYFPQVGDAPQVVQDKKRRLENLLSAARIKAGRATPDDMGLPAGVTVTKVSE